MTEISNLDQIQTMLPSPFEGPQAKEEQGESFLNTLNDAIGEVNELRNEADRAVEGGPIGCGGQGCQQPHCGDDRFGCGSGCPTGRHPNRHRHWHASG